jgi:outer membrane usher protein
LRRGSFRRRASGCAIGALAAIVAAPAGGQTPAPTSAPQESRTGAGTVTLPMTDNGRLIGEVDAFSSPSGEISLPSARLIELVGSRLGDEARERLETQLAGRVSIDLATAAALETPIAYDPERLELKLTIPVELRGQRGVSLVDNDFNNRGPAESPAGFSAFLTANGSIDYIHQSQTDETGFGNASIILTGAVRAAGIVAETLALWRPNQAGPDFQRQASRLVYDDVGSPLRIIAGDLLVVPTLFQNAPDAGGIAFVRSYQLLQPMRIVRPSGGQSFQLTVPSAVDILVNGRSARRIRLEPGNYNVRDFPFAQGGNDIRVLVDQGAGPREVLRYSVFYDTQQLQPGLDEFAFYAGVRSELGPSGPEYSDHWLVSGFYRRGFTDSLTAGGHFQADADSQMGGLNGLLSTQFGLLGGDFALSNADGFGMGWAGSLTFERTFSGAGTINLRFETRSRDFAPLGSVPPTNPFAWEASGAISHTFSERFYAGADLSYSKGRGLLPNRAYYRANAGYQLSRRLELEINGTYEDSPEYSGFSVFATLTFRANDRSTARAEYDSRYQRGRLAYSTFHGQDVGQWDLSLDANHGASGGDFNAVGNYTSERALFGLTHFTTWDEGFAAIADQRTSARAAASIVFADGRLALARPILNGFAIIEPHRSARGGRLVVNPIENGHLAASDWLGPAVVPDLSAYSEREVFVEPNGMPVGYDIGPGAYRFEAPYRGAYRIVVGSDYWMTASGLLLRADGSPLTYAAGEAYEVGGPEDRAPVTFFTSSDGRYSISGVKPGRWRLTMTTDPPTLFEIEVGEAEDGLFSVADASPVEGN